MYLILKHFLIFRAFFSTDRGGLVKNAAASLKYSSVLKRSRLLNSNIFESRECIAQQKSTAT